ncbi:MAG: LytTR family DNA-binding domain-containing protein [Sphingobacteriaceae bacterium]|nr:LytTR family DNA-binding domain-containing protein [Sphingobacteriaceae bacterium]
MKIVLIEDEPLAMQRMEKLLSKIIQPLEVVAKLDSVESALNWFGAHPSEIDLILADIQLGDGLSLEIFEKTNNQTPVIFTTAHNEYALEAFKHLSIDYLLKPINEESLSVAIDKFQRLAKTRVPDFQALSQLFQLGGKAYQKRLVIKFGNSIKAIDIADIAAFYVEERVCMMCTFDGRQLAADQNLEQLEAMLDPKQFFRINRKVIVNVRAIKNMEMYSRSRVSLQLNPPIKAELIVSTERAAAFKKWLEG